MVDKYLNPIKYFKFLNCWPNQPSFKETVKECCNRPIAGNPMWSFHQNMKRLASTLSSWSRIQFGDIYARVKKYEEEEGDVNSSYFHALVRWRRRKLYIHKIQTDDGSWVQGDAEIPEAACNHFQEILTKGDKYIQQQALQCISSMITEKHNKDLQDMHTMDELRTIVFSMNPNSAAGPDGMNGKTFQLCWDIIKEDFLSVVNSLFSGQAMPKFFTHFVWFYSQK
ncbi:uncharacterized protein LOC129899842 [Solanum dulcamara]|uniref:uncharacterized protein LOC129899842 n=1 Tax=Solanum dulcamara TaxID=45834 RepID=UPI002484EF5E|nr:uncharacterized protein LOC129899842 [Solanum dulcamara]